MDCSGRLSPEKLTMKSGAVLCLNTEHWVEPNYHSVIKDNLWRICTKLVAILMFWGG